MQNFDARILCLSILLLAGIAGCAGSDSSDSAGTDASPRGDGGAGDGTDAMPVAAVPTEGAALFTYLQGRNYQGFVAEPAAHPSSGPHGRVRTFFNPELAASLERGDSQHPVGAASVKELFTGETLTGWAVMVKTSASANEASWYYYEIFSTTDGSSPVADGNGVSLCAGCHSGGTDFILSELPTM